MHAKKYYSRNFINFLAYVSVLVNVSVLVHVICISMCINFGFLLNVADLISLVSSLAFESVRKCFELEFQPWKGFKEYFISHVSFESSNR